MKVAIIGRTEILYETAKLLKEKGYEIALIITSKEEVEYTKTSYDFECLAAEWGIPFLHSSKITTAIDTIQECGEIDIGVSLNYNGIIPKSVVSLFSLGILNAHGGDLPKYRGNACQAWAILNSEERIGLCIHRMIADELDSGDIISRDYFSIDLNTKITDVYRWISERIPDLFYDALERIRSDATYILQTQSNNPSDILRCYPRKPEDGKVVWSNSAEDILRLINASNKPYAGAFCGFNNSKLIIWDAELAGEEKYLAIPGQVTRIGDGFVDVATGSGKLKVKQVEYNNSLVTPDEIIISTRERLK